MRGPATHWPSTHVSFTVHASPVLQGVWPGGFGGQSALSPSQIAFCRHCSAVCRQTVPRGSTALQSAAQQVSVARPGSHSSSASTTPLPQTPADGGRVVVVAAVVVVDVLVVEVVVVIDVLVAVV